MASMPVFYQATLTAPGQNVSQQTQQHPHLSQQNSQHMQQCYMGAPQSQVKFKSS